MPHRHELRRLAMQVLYEIDMAGLSERSELIETLEDSPGNAAAHQQAVDLAIAAWQDHSEADEHISVLTPDWPTHRQPPVDRAILRLAYHEMTSGHAPMRVAINEAVELAKHFAGENSPSFINGVLDKLARRIKAQDPAEEPKPMRGSPENPDGKKPDAQAWLSDAVQKKT